MSITATVPSRGACGHQERPPRLTAPCLHLVPTLLRVVFLDGAGYASGDGISLRPFSRPKAVNSRQLSGWAVMAPVFPGCHH